MRLPKINGYFWVERDGEIVAWDFPELTRLCKKFKCVTDVHAYLPAPPKVENAMIRLFEKLTLKAFQTDDWNEMMSEFILVAKMTGNGDKALFNKSWTNVIQEAYYNGGKIRFGSMGFKKKDGTYHWHYGHEDSKVLIDFFG